MASSKGYRVLPDTDGKFGATRLYGDPDYQAATTGVNGNPSFEIEIVLETNFRIASYITDGTSTPCWWSNTPTGKNVRRYPFLPLTVTETLVF